MTAPHKSQSTANGAPVVHRGFAHLAVGIDFTAASLGAARWATNHLAPGASAALVHVVPLPDGDVYERAERIMQERMLRQMAPALLGGLGGFAATLDIGDARTLVRFGRPSRTLVRVADRLGADLVVLGRTWRPASRPPHEPGLVERVARQVKASLLAVPPGAHGAPEHVVAAVDDGPFVSQIVETARGVAAAHEAPLTLIHVLSPVHGAFERLTRLQLAGGDPPALPASGHAARSIATARRRLTDLLQDLGDVRRADVKVVIGQAGTEILRAMKRLPGALLVMSKRGADGSPRGSLGSVSRHALNHGGSPVLLLDGEDGS
jgi:nucleotide-binding universal stress UspA family protein